MGQNDQIRTAETQVAEFEDRLARLADETLQSGSDTDQEREALDRIRLKLKTIKESLSGTDAADATSDTSADAMARRAEIIAKHPPETTSFAAESYISNLRDIMARLDGVLARLGND